MRHRTPLIAVLGSAPAALALSTVALGLAAGTAHAEVNGHCDGSANFAEGTEADGPFTIDARSAGGDVVVVPRADTVTWTGSVDAPPGEYSGHISLDLPPLFPDVEIDSWSGDSDNTSNSGVEEYDVPSIVPAGVTIHVLGEHHDENGVCTGDVAVEIEGGPFSSPLTYASLGLTAATGGALFAAVRPLFKKVV